MTIGKKLSEEQGQALIAYARQVIAEKLHVEYTVTSKVRQVLADPLFNQKSATFVTLQLHGNLRGCIGSLVAAESIKQGIRRNALNAAFHDNRFLPLSQDEFDQISIEVSVLTEPVQLEYTDSSDLLEKLRVNIDGVILKKGFASATFLPQVWEQLPNPEDFLAHLCMKAGLSMNMWQNEHLDVSIYQVQKFKEEAC